MRQATHGCGRGRAGRQGRHLSSGSMKEDALASKKVLPMYSSFTTHSTCSHQDRPPSIMQAISAQPYGGDTQTLRKTPGRPSLSAHACVIMEVVLAHLARPHSMHNLQRDAAVAHHRHTLR